MAAGEVRRTRRRAGGTPWKERTDVPRIDLNSDLVAVPLRATDTDGAVGIRQRPDAQEAPRLDNPSTDGAGAEPRLVASLLPAPTGDTAV
jgi:hypothetical protein